jgi:AraC family transcriptional regulator, transcriptional activator of the genes for pyochelin and ferripyochelin receptors
MFRAITEADWEELCQEAISVGETIRTQKDDELEFFLPKKIGFGSDLTISLRNGLAIDRLDLKLSQSLRFERYHDSFFPLVSKFYLAGNSRVLTPGSKDIEEDYEELCGHNYLYYLPNLKEYEDWQAQQNIHVLMIFVYPEYLRSFQGNCEFLPHPLQELIQGKFTPCFHQPLGKITPNMRQIIQQLLNCPYQGLMRQIFLESKALELLMLQFNLWLQNNSQSRQLNLKNDDLDRLHYAKNLLAKNLHDPPSLIDLSRMVGINDYKLKIGFRQVFGTTPFSYLRDLRLEKAQQLLQEREIQVEAVAKLVGYKSRSKFSVAFTKKFGINPKSFQLQNYSSSD